MDEKRKRFFKKIVSLISFTIILVLFAFITYFFMVKFKEMKSVQSFKEYIQSFGANGVLVGLGLQTVQIFVAFIPGEVVEIGLGFAFGATVGTIICFAGIAMASSAVFLFVKRFGTRFVELFVPIDRINDIKFIGKIVNDRKKLRITLFLLFFVPGTPKDLFTYFFGLTPLKLSEFLWVSMVARIPSVISSTIGGTLVANGKYLLAVVLFVVTAILSLLGIICYNSYEKKNTSK